MQEELSRTARLLGEDAMARLRAARVAVFGIGGVGGYVVEALARSGIGALDLIDGDTVSRSNINRQIIATQETVGMEKAEAAAARVRSIDPTIAVTAHRCFYLPENADAFDFSQYDYVVDAIDTVAGKLAIILRAKAAGVPVISSMGAGNKLDPTAFRVADIYATKVCPLARAMRGLLRKNGVDALKVVYSEEQPLARCAENEDPESPRRAVPASIAFVPSVAGLILAGEVIKDLAGINTKRGIS